MANLKILAYDASTKAAPLASMCAQVMEEWYDLVEAWTATADGALIQVSMSR